MEEKLKESKIYNFNEYDTVYIPKGYNLKDAIEWYEKQFDEIDKNKFCEVDYSNYYFNDENGLEKITFAEAKEENDKLGSDIFIICSTEY